MLRPLFHMLFYLSLIFDGYSKIHLGKTKGMENKQKDNSTSGNSKIFLVKTKNMENKQKDNVTSGNSKIHPEKTEDMKNKQKDNITSGNNKIYLVKTKDKKNNTRKDNSTSDLTSKKKIRKIGSKGNDYQAEIAGGIAVKNHDYPWMVQLKYGCVCETCSCGGALLSDRLVLTAYHCTHPSKSKKPCDHSDKKRLAIMGQLELHNKKSTENTGIAIPVIKVIYPEHDHAGFDPKEDSIEDHDFAMYLLETPVKFTDNIQPICLPQQGQEFAGEIAIAAGWGHTESIKKVTDLREVNLTVDEKKYAHRKMFGTKLEKNADGEYMDPCSGDSGGPLMKMLGHRKAIVIGTVYGDGYNCITGNVSNTEGVKKGLWNKVSHWVDWIRDEMKKLSQTESDECQSIRNEYSKKKTREPSPDVPSPPIDVSDLDCYLEEEEALVCGLCGENDCYKTDECYWSIDEGHCESMEEDEDEGSGGDVLADLEVFKDLLAKEDEKFNNFVSSPGRADHFPHQSSRDCSCNGYMDFAGRGECSTMYHGCYWCYVDKTSSCRDKIFPEYYGVKHGDYYGVKYASCQACKNRRRTLTRRTTSMRRTRHPRPRRRYDYPSYYHG